MVNAALRLKRLPTPEIKESECWEEWSENVLRAAKKVCGISKGGHKQKTTWWWNTQVREAAKAKRLLHKRCQKDKEPSQENSAGPKKGKLRELSQRHKKRMARRLLNSLNEVNISVDTKKSLNGVLREVICWALRKKEEVGKEK